MGCGACREGWSVTARHTSTASFLRGALGRIAPTMLLVLGLAFVARDAAANRGQTEQLSDLAVFNRVVVLVKEQYVEPARIRPREMLRAALDAVEKTVPEVLVEEVDDDTVKVSVGSAAGTEVRTFSLRDTTSLWEMSFRLASIFRFLETRISPEVDRRDVEYAAINGMLGKLDPHSVLLEPRFSQEMKLSTKGEFGGLGIVISIRDGGLTVISPIEGTPADGVGIKAQDKIVKIGEESTVNMGLDEAVERLRGKPGTTITIWVMRKGWEEARRFDIVRAVIKVDAVSTERVGDLAYVKIKQFAGHVAEDVAVGVEKAAAKGKAPLRGVILDLRNNPGGLLDQAVEVSNLFLKDGVLVVTQEGQGAGSRREVKANASDQRIDLPVVVLVNGGSASASEIVAGALKNRGRGFIIGDQTFGKGSVQQLYDFPDSSALKLTIGQYLTPGDESIQSVGITPDLQLHPILAASKENLNILPDEHTREEDLDRHLDDARTKASKPTFELAYLAEAVDADEAERRDANAKFVDDFETRLARRLLEQAPPATDFKRAPLGRDGLRALAKDVVQQVSGEEERRIADALAKLGVDWSAGTSSGAASLVVTVVDNKPVKAGDTLSLTLQAKNTGTQPLFRVRGNTESTLGYLADREFLFGRLAPGEARSFTVDVKIPRDLQGRRDVVRVAVADDGRTLARADVPVTIEGLARPRFAYSLFVDDGAGGKDTNGNGDGLLQVGESVALVVGIKNTGVGPSPEPTALLKNLGGPEVFIDVGRQRMGALAPGASSVARFAFKVTAPPDQPAPTSVSLRLQVFDGVMGDYLVEKLSLPVRPATSTAKKVKSLVQASAAVSVLAAADASSRVLGRLDAGARVETVGEINGFVRLDLGGGNQYGYVAQNAVGPASGKATITASGTPQGFSPVYGRDPPTIRFIDGAGAAVGEVVTTDATTFDVTAKIDDDGGVADVSVYVGDQKVHYERLPPKKPTASTLRYRVALKPGVNVVTVVAREDDEFAQREVLTVFSTKGDPFAEKKTGRH
jgi:carboxyl-terminal processing protease